MRGAKVIARPVQEADTRLRVALLVSRTVCHASSLEARLPPAHPATVEPTPAQWREKTAVRSRRAGGDETPPVGGAVPAGRRGRYRSLPDGPPPGGNARFSV
ncbi:hypothetical protein GCM10023097_09660 [Streptomyces collinus]